MQNSIKDSVQEIIITLSAIHYTVKNSTATDFTFEGDLSKVQDLAKLPSKQELLAKAVGSIKAPISGFVNVIAGNMRGLVNVLNAIKDTK